MRKRFSLAAAPVILLTAACGGGLEQIERLDLEGRELRSVDGFDAALADQYPGIIAIVNGEEIISEDLVVRLVGLELARRQALEQPEILHQYSLPEIDAVDPLEELVDIELLAQAAERLGYVPSYEEAAEEAALVEGLFSVAGLLAAEMAAISLARGWPTEGWAESDVVVES